MPDLSGKVAIVTGCGSGIGAAALARLRADGAQVLGTDVNADSGRTVAEKHGATFAEQDVRDEAHWKEIIAEVETLHGGLDILVNNAGNVIFEDILECSLEHFKLHLDIHVVGTFLGCQNGIPLMAKSGGGSIINMASTASLLGYGNIPAYTAAKGAIRSMTKSIAMYCQDEDNKIRCNVLMPGGIETPMVQGVSGRAGEEPMDIPEGVLPKDSLGAPKDVANTVLFLASDESRFMTGNELPVDNGLFARPER